LAIPDVVVVVADVIETPSVPAIVAPWSTVLSAVEVAWSYAKLTPIPWVMLDWLNSMPMASVRRKNALSFELKGKLW